MKGIGWFINQLSPQTVHSILPQGLHFLWLFFSHFSLSLFFFHMLLNKPILSNHLLNCLHIFWTGNQYSISGPYALAFFYFTALHFVYHISKAIKLIGCFSLNILNNFYITEEEENWKQGKKLFQCKAVSLELNSKAAILILLNIMMKPLHTNSFSHRQK